MCISCQKRSSRGTQILMRRSKAPWDSDTAAGAALKGHLHILEYLVERKYDKYDVWACEYAARNGHLDCLKYLHETAKAPWDSHTVREAQRTTTQNVYNTSSTTTVLSHLVGDTNMENCTRPNHHNNNTNTSRARICFKALVITYTQRERDINTPRALLSNSFLGDSPNLGNPKTNAKREFFRGTPYSRALTLIKTCAQKTESNISADKKRMHCEQRVR